MSFATTSASAAADDALTVISLSHRRSLARLAVRKPADPSRVARFVAGESLAEALPAMPHSSTRVPYHRRRPGRIRHLARACRRGSRSYLATVAALSERGLDPNVSLKLTQMGLAIDRDLCRTNVLRVVRPSAGVGGFTASTWRTTPRPTPRWMSGGRPTRRTPRWAW